MSEEIVQNHTKPEKPVPLWYYDAFGLRIMGLTLEQIAERTGKSHSHVRSLFASKGRIYKFWREYVESRKKDAHEEILDMIWGHLPDVIRARIVHAKTLGMGSNQAAEILLKYTLGDPSKPSVQNNIQINDNRITGFNYIVPQKPNDSNNNSNLETAPSLPSIERSGN